MKRFILIALLSIPISGIAQLGFSIGSTTFKTDLLDSNWGQTSLGDYKGLSFQTIYKFDHIIVSTSSDLIIHSEQAYSEVLNPLLAYYRIGLQGITELGRFNVHPGMTFGYYTSSSEDSIPVIYGDDIVSKTVERNLGFSIGGDIVYPFPKKFSLFIGFDYNILFNGKAKTEDQEPEEINGYNFMTLNFGLQYWLWEKSEE